MIEEMIYVHVHYENVFVQLYIVLKILYHSKVNFSTD